MIEYTRELFELETNGEGQAYARIGISDTCGWTDGYVVWLETKVQELSRPNEENKKREEARNV